MEFKDVFHECSDHILNSDGVFEGNEVGIFCKSINHYQDHVFVMRYRRAFNEVHGDVAPSKIKHR